MADIFFRENKFFLSGEIDFFNVMAIYKKSLILIKKNSKLIFDFSQLKSSNSAAIALIIEWIKIGEEEHKTIRFENLSSDLINIATVAGIDLMILAYVN